MVNVEQIISHCWGKTLLSILFDAWWILFFSSLAGGNRHYFQSNPMGVGVFLLIILGGSFPSLCYFPDLHKNLEGCFADIQSSFSEISSSWWSDFQVVAVSSVQSVCWFPSWPGNSLKARTWDSLRAHLICFLALRCHWLSWSDVQCLENHLKNVYILISWLFRAKS